MKPLYLDGSTTEYIKLEHDAIRVISSKYADTWVPLKRISRVILSGDIELSTPVLAAALAQGISITVAGKHGEFAGVCFGIRQRSQLLPSHVTEVQTSAEQQHIIENWFSAQHRRHVLRLQKKFRLPRDTLSTEAVKAKLDEYICLEGDFYDWPNCLRKLIPMLAAQQVMLLKSFGFTSETLRPAPADIGLLQQFINLQEWELWTLAANGHLPSGTLRKQLIHYFHEQEPAIEHATRHLINQLWHRFYEVEHEQD